MNQTCTGCGRPVDPVRIFCMYCGRKIGGSHVRGSRSTRRPMLIPAGLIGMILGGAAGYFVRPSAAMRSLAWDARDATSGAFSHLFAATAQGTFFRVVVLAAAGLFIGLLIGWFARRPH
jgi:hypothetical protein